MLSRFTKITADNSLYYFNKNRALEVLKTVFINNIVSIFFPLLPPIWKQNVVVHFVTNR